MVDRRQRVLLLILAAAAGISASGIAVSEGVGRLAAARADAVRYEARIARLRESVPTAVVGAGAREVLADEIAARRARLYGPDEMNPYSFGTLVKSTLSSRGISVLRYQVVEVKGAPYVEFTASGSARSFVSFLRDVSDYGKAWSIPSMSLTLREGTDSADMVFRIGYATADATGR
ncbi:MAG: hypothetical protein A2177_03500 [Spirochaetes bacterium RBG_13_68_11]|nr:MAG: hypothetical protein A2177_03500 [Spirochaetes bacterium RBG_13_68_11]